MDTYLHHEKHIFWYASLEDRGTANNTANEKPAQKEYSFKLDTLPKQQTGGAAIPFHEDKP